MQPSAAMAVTEQQRRARALAMLRTLHGESERVRAGRRRIQWCSIDVIVKQPADVNVLAYAVDQGWIAIAPNGQSVRVNSKAAVWSLSKGAEKGTLEFVPSGSGGNIGGHTERHAKKAGERRSGSDPPPERHEPRRSTFSW